MPEAIVNGIRRQVPKLNHSKDDLQFAFKSRNQLPFFMVWRVFYDEEGNVVFGEVLFNSQDWIGW